MAAATPDPISPRCSQERTTLAVPRLLVVPRPPGRQEAQLEARYGLAVQARGIVMGSRFLVSKIVLTFISLILIIVCVCALPATKSRWHGLSKCQIVSELGAPSRTWARSDIHRPDPQGAYFEEVSVRGSTYMFVYNNDYICIRAILKND